jgi:hypothetical protein
MRVVPALTRFEVDDRLLLPVLIRIGGNHRWDDVSVASVPSSRLFMAVFAKRRHA